MVLVSESASESSGNPASVTSSRCPGSAVEPRPCEICCVIGGVPRPDAAGESSRRRRGGGGVVSAGPETMALRRRVPHTLPAAAQVVVIACVVSSVDDCAAIVDEAELSQQHIAVAVTNEEDGPFVHCLFGDSVVTG